MLYKLSQSGYILNFKGEIESITYKDYLYEFGSDETTTGNGIAPRIYVDGNSLMSWGVRGNNHHFYASFKNKREATVALYEILEGNLENEENLPSRFFPTKKELFEYLAVFHSKDIAVIKRFFRLSDYKKEALRVSKLKYDNRPSFSKDKMLNYIEENRQTIQEKMDYLDELKASEQKELWQKEANSLIMQVSSNDFRVFNWKEIYKLIRNQFYN